MIQVVNTDDEKLGKDIYFYRTNRHNNNNTETE